MSAPQTTVYIKVNHSCWPSGELTGEIQAGSFEWTFAWHFRQDKLRLTPPLGSALVSEAVHRFLERHDYNLELGEIYSFVLKARI
jgi:hypothetical protein